MNFDWFCRGLRQEIKALKEEAFSLHERLMDRTQAFEEERQHLHALIRALRDVNADLDRERVALFQKD